MWSDTGVVYHTVVNGGKKSERKAFWIDSQLNLYETCRAKGAKGYSMGGHWSNVSQWCNIISSQAMELADYQYVLWTFLLLLARTCIYYLIYCDQNQHEKWRQYLVVTSPSQLLMRMWTSSDANVLRTIRLKSVTFIYRMMGWRWENLYTALFAVMPCGPQLAKVGISFNIFFFLDEGGFGWEEL